MSLEVINELKEINDIDNKNINNGPLTNFTIAEIQEYERQLRSLTSEINLEIKKNKYLTQEIQKRKIEVEVISKDLGKMKKVIEKNQEQVKVLKKDEAFLEKMTKFAKNKLLI